MEEQVDIEKIKEDNHRRLFLGYAIALGLVSAEEADYEKGVSKSIEKTI